MENINKATKANYNLSFFAFGWNDDIKSVW